MQGTENFAQILAEKRAQAAKTMRGRASPAKLLEALQAAVEKPFDEGLKVEAAISALGQHQFSDQRIGAGGR